MSVINTNVSAILTQNSLLKNERAMSGAMEQLSTGKRINSSADDAAGLSIASRMTAQINGLNQAVRNGNDAISLVQTADGALIEVTSMLQRMRTLAVQSASDTNTTADRTALNTEFELLRTEIDRIGTNTQWNGENVLDQSHSSSTGAYKFQVGANGAQTIDLTIDNYTTSGAGGTAAGHHRAHHGPPGAEARHRGSSLQTSQVAHSRGLVVSIPRMLWQTAVDFRSGYTGVAPRSLGLDVSFARHAHPPVSFSPARWLRGQGSGGDRREWPRPR